MFRGDRVPVIDAGGTSAVVTLTRPRLEELLRSALALSDDTASHVWLSTVAGSTDLRPCSEYGKLNRIQEMPDPERPSANAIRRG